jgi:drug/metabolite transporter (DMT)-like permease
MALGLVLILNRGAVLGAFVDIKSFAIFAPFLAAIGWGVQYAVFGHALKSLSVPALMLATAIIWPITLVIVSLSVSWISGEPIDFKPLATRSVQITFFATIFLSSMVWVLTLLATKHISPTYAALGEISFPLFTALFAWLFYGDKQWNWTILAGAVLLLAGSFLIIQGQSQSTPDSTAAELTETETPNARL